MAQTTINIRMDEELKKSFENVCEELGLNMSTAMTIFAKKMSRERRIPFEVSYDPFPNRICRQSGKAEHKYKAETPFSKRWTN